MLTSPKSLGGGLTGPDRQHIFFRRRHGLNH
jgi:hypothetical protein